VRRPPRARRWRWLIALADGVDGAWRSLRRPSWRQLGALSYLACDIAALGAAFAAAGRPLPVAPLVLGYLIGYLANLIPVPGGFGVLEGGLAGALIAYGAPATQAAAAVIVYHAISFWIPSLGGVAGYALLRRRPRHAPRPHVAPAPAHVTVGASTVTAAHPAASASRTRLTVAPGRTCSPGAS
jgi:Lysylphosphatidylglycerol synthase TM region